MTTTTTTEYGFRSTDKSRLHDERLIWARGDGVISPYRAQRLGFVDASDLDAMHAAVESYNSVGRSFTVAVVSRQRLVTVGEPEVVPAPVKVDPKLVGLAPGSIVRASKPGYGRGLYVLTVDTDGIPWKGISQGANAGAWSQGKTLRDIEHVHVVEA